MILIIVRPDLVNAQQGEHLVGAAERISWGRAEHYCETYLPEWKVYHDDDQAKLTVQLPDATVVAYLVDLRHTVILRQGACEQWLGDHERQPMTSEERAYMQKLIEDTNNSGRKV